MRLLLDTHAFLWWLAGDRKMSRRARELVAATETECLVSAASAWEITTKVRLGKLPGVEVIARDVSGAIASQGFVELPIRVIHAQWAGTLPSDHRDPFDRMLAAQAHVEGVPLLSVDTVFDGLGVPRIW